jgi:chemotaxis response regulator CheB
VAADNRWLLRESRQPTACLELVRQARPSILVLNLERRLVDELTLLADVHEHAPDCPVLVVSDVKLEGPAQRLNLAGLAYDLGAGYVMFPPLEQSLLEDVTAGLLSAAIRRSVSGVEEDANA